MDDYISRQAAIEGLKDYFSDEARTETEYGAYWHHIHVLQFLEDISPADVRPVVRGKWIDEDLYKQTMSGKTYDGFTYCSDCKRSFSFGYRSRFCPNCGADMSGGDAE